MFDICLKSVKSQTISAFVHLFVAYEHFYVTELGFGVRGQQ